MPKNSNSVSLHFDTETFHCLVFWMFSYVFVHIDVLVLRHRLPKAPRSFKVPFGPVLPIIGTSYMVFNISTDPKERFMIWAITGIAFLMLFLYSVVWNKKKMKMPVFKSVSMEKVLAIFILNLKIWGWPKGLWVTIHG